MSRVHLTFVSSSIAGTEQQHRHDVWGRQHEQTDKGDVICFNIQPSVGEVLVKMASLFHVAILLISAEASGTQQVFESLSARLLFECKGR